MFNCARKSIVVNSMFIINAQVVVIYKKKEFNLFISYVFGIIKIDLHT